MCASHNTYQIDSRDFVQFHRGSRMYWEHLRQGLQSTGESFRHAGGMIADGEGAFRASCLC